jgi:hypothetical protein
MLFSRYHRKMIRMFAFSLPLFSGRHSDRGASLFQPSFLFSSLPCPFGQGFYYGKLPILLTVLVDVRMLKRAVNVAL